MSETGGPKPRAGRRVAVLDGRRAAADWAARAADFFSLIGTWIANALRAEADAGRLAPWLAVGFGAGIVLYFAAPSEPSLYAPVIVLVLFASIAWVSREQPAAFALSLALLSIAAGFGAGCLRAAMIAHPVLTRATGTVILKGYVEARDGSERSDRIVLRVSNASGAGAERVPPRVRVALRRGFAPKVGEQVEVLVRLRPLIGPVRPGGFDFALNGYFAQLGATGFVLGRAKVLAAPDQAPFDIRVRASIESARRRMTERIRLVLPSEAGAVATALVTGMRDAIPAEINEAMRISGLAHVLAISGLHMVLVVGALFALVRGGLALIPGLALRRPVKKWAATAALAGAAGYLVLSGAAVSTQRAFVMIAVVLLGVLIDRPALTVRTLATAAVVLLLLTPEAILHPSFQMSFAATLALVALFERFAPMLARPPAEGSGVVGRFTERIGRWIILGAATSLAAGLATTVYAAFHFHRVAPYGLISNVLAMPVLSFVIMPAGLFSVLLQPFGYDALGWKAMGAGIELMLSVARFVSALPGAEGRVAAFGGAAVLIASAGLLVLAIPATRLRLAGLPLLAGALFLAMTAPKPDVLIDAENDVVAVRGADGRLSILNARRGRLAAESWLAADADGRKAGDDLAQGFTCDAFGCVASLADGARIAVARRHEAFLDDCREAALVVTRLHAPPGCEAPFIDRRTLSTTGAIALRRVDSKWIAEPARSPFEDRPWFARAARPDAAVLLRIEGQPSAVREFAQSSLEEDNVPTPDAEDADGE